MRILHGRHFQSRYQAIIQHVPEGASVLELCMGDAYLYRHYLKAKKVRYTGLDSSISFIEKARAQGINASLSTIDVDPLPQAEIVIMQASLFHFPRNYEAVLRRAIQAATRRVILAEPVINMASSPNPVLSMLGRVLTKPQGVTNEQSFRFNETSFRALIAKIPECESLEFEPGGREMVAVLRGGATVSAAS